MSKGGSWLTRRGFLGTSAAALAGGLSAPLLGSRALAQAPAPSVAQPLSALAPGAAPDEAFWWKVRGQFNIVDGMTFMNNGTLGPAPRCVLDTNGRIAREVSEDPTNGYRNDDRNVVRERVAAFVGAKADEIALTRSTTEGMNIFAHGLDLREGDEILFCTHEHGGGWHVYTTLQERKGVKINRIEIPSPPESIDQVVELYEKAITPRTRVLMVSHITYVTGLVMPVKELSEMAHRHGVLVSVDGAHPVGMIDVDLAALGCDHYAAAGQKWLLAGTGTGICYVKEGLQDQVWPLTGWVNKDNRTDNNRGARKYEDNGQKHVPSVIGMGTAVEFQQTIGKPHIENRVRQLSQRLREGLKEIPGVKLWTSTDPALSAALTLFSVRDIPMENVQKACMDLDRVFIRTMSTGNLNACRASTHFYNMPEEVDRLLAAVRHVSENAGKYMTPTADAAIQWDETAG